MSPPSKIERRLVREDYTSNHTTTEGNMMIPNADGTKERYVWCTHPDYGVELPGLGDRRLQSTSDDTSEDAPEDASDDTPDDTPEGTSEDASEEASDDTPGDTSEDASEDASEEVSEDTSEEASEEASKEASEDSSKDMLEDMSEDILQGTAEVREEGTAEDSTKQESTNVDEEDDGMAKMVAALLLINKRIKELRASLRALYVEQAFRTTRDSLRGEGSDVGHGKGPSRERADIQEQSVDDILRATGLSRTASGFVARTSEIAVNAANALMVAQGLGGGDEREGEEVGEREQWSRDEQGVWL